MSITTVDPATGCPLTTYDEHDDAAVEAVLGHADEATRAWGRVPVAERCAAVACLGALLREESEHLAALITAEMGKPLAEARAEVEKCAVTCEHYATHGPEMLAPEPADVDDARAWVAYEPMGLVLAVMPWNFPLWQVIRFAAPALTAGNGVLLKHSPNVTGSALTLESLAQDAGLPPWLFTTLVIGEPRVPEVTARLIADDRVAAVTLTGSNRAGAAIGAAAGRHVKKAVLELGGSDAFVVLSDADVPAAATAAVKARFQNAGQSCICGKRFVVAASVAEDFLDQFVALAAQCELGPMARGDLRDELHRQVTDAVSAGAKLLLGGEPVDGDGYFYEPTVMVAGPGTAVFDEETFGPVAAVVVAEDDAEAARLAGDTAYGLGLSVWSADPERALALAREVTTGAVFVNAVVASDPRVPFGGTKKSGHGRELSVQGMREFTNTRTYWLAG